MYHKTGPAPPASPPCEVERVGQPAQLLVQQGDAITEQDKPHIFERFYRGEWARKVKISGTGLGLYIAKLLIEEMGGSVGFQSEAGTGTVFWFTLKTPNV